MKGQWKKGGRVVAILFATAAAGLAQTGMTAQGPAGSPGAANNLHGPSIPGSMDSRSGAMASPGAVNYIEGHATLDGRALLASAVGSTVVEPNQVIGTSDGYAEILLTPGAFLRIGHNSEVRFVSAGLIGVELELDHGSAMVEAAELVKGSHLEVRMNGATAQIENKGLYAFDAGQGSLRVLEGKAVVIESAGQTTLRKADELLLASDRPLKKRNFEIKAAEAEPLYVWSKVRSQDESEANANLARDIARNGGWNGPGWYWNPFWSDYAFMPGAGMLYSPFGWGYYSPAFAFAGGFGSYGYGGYGYGLRGTYVRGYYGHGFRGVSGVRTGVRSYQGGGFHGGGGGFHGGGHR